MEVENVNNLEISKIMMKILLMLNIFKQTMPHHY